MDPGEMMKKLFGGNSETEYEPLGSMTDDQVKEWTEIRDLAIQAKSLMREADARKELFWLKLEKETNTAHRNVKVEVEDRMIYVEKVGGKSSAS